MADKNKKKASLGWFFWVAFILLVALLFFINKENISTVLEKTGAKNLFQKTEQDDAAKSESDLVEIQNEIEKITAETQEEGSSDTKEEKKAVSVSEKDTKSKNVSSEKKTENKKAADESLKKTAEDKKSAPAAKIGSNEKTGAAGQSDKAENSSNKQADAQKADVIKTEKRNIFFVQVESDGRITRKKINRDISKTDSPMSETVKVLLQGVSTEEAKKGLRSFIPPDTKLLSAYVKNGTAFISFSEEFQFNRYGIEAYYAQLAQIVFTVCEFPTVQNVQILIEGQHKDFLGGEGVWIGSPLSKESF